MTFVVMFVMLGKDGAYTMARASKKVDVDYLVQVHGDGTRELLGFCKSVIERDLTPTTGMYDDLLANMERIIKELVLWRRRQSHPPWGYLRIQPTSLMAKTANKQMRDLAKK